MPTCLINFAYLDPPINGGVSRIAREAALALLDEAPPSFHIVFAVKLRFIPRFTRWLGAGRNVAIIPYSLHIPADFFLRLIHPDVIISPLFGMEPFIKSGAVPHVVSIPDTLSLDHPELFSDAEAQLRQRPYQFLSSARQIITLSQFARQQILHHLPVSTEQVRIIEPGADGLPPSVPMPDIPKPYVFYPANTWPHKNHELLLQTMLFIWKERPELTLVLSGGRPPNVDLTALLRRYAPGGKVVDLGYVSDGQIAALYQQSEAMVFTSQYEGFGMPVLEAMHAGCPVICAPVTSLPEIAGDAALYVSSTDPEAWADAFLSQLPSQRTALIRRGYQQAAKFTWKQTRHKWVEAVLNAVDAPLEEG
jgi:glycosyltransferase involved in cell wall biosynthesis